MTTIAYKDGVMAGDGRVSCTETGHVFMDTSVKVWKLPDGGLFGAAGCDEDIALVHGALMAGKSKIPDHLEEIFGVWVKPNGDVYVTEGAPWHKWGEDFIAIGSGKRCAHTALKLGHDAVTAVKMGIEGDVYSGGAITIVELGNGSGKKRAGNRKRKQQAISDGEHRNGATRRKRAPVRPVRANQRNRRSGISRRV